MVSKLCEICGNPASIVYLYFMGYEQVDQCPLCPTHQGVIP